MVYEKVGLANFFQYIIIIILFIIFLFYIMKSSPSPPPLQGIGALLRALPVWITAENGRVQLAPDQRAKRWPGKFIFH